MILRRTWLLMLVLVACADDAERPKPDAGHEAESTPGEVEGAGVEVPPGANDGGPELTVTLRAESVVAAADLPEGDEAFAVGPAVTFGPAGTTFAVPVTIELPFSSDDFNGSALEEKTFGVLVQEDSESEATLLFDPEPVTQFDDDIDPLGYQIGPVGIVANDGSEQFDRIARVEVDHFTTFQVVLVGSETAVGLPEDECASLADGADCQVSWPIACSIPAACLSGACEPAPHAPAVGPAIKPEEAGAEAADGEMPGWANFPLATRLAGADFVGFELQTFGPIPTELPPEVTFAEYGLLFFGSGDGTPDQPHPPWEGATHRLVVSQDAELPGWTGRVLLWDPGANDWVVDTPEVPFEIDGQTVRATATIGGVDACTPYKVLSQARANGTLYWKALTADPATPTEPNGAPFAYE